MKELKDFPGYFITEDGRVYSNISNKLKLMKPQKTYRGYYYIDLRIEKNKLRRYIHRLVAETYIDNPNNLPQVNHIDENKTNNNLDNLEWCSNHHNAIHSHCRWKWKIKNIITGELYETINISEFCRCYELDQSGLYKTFIGKRSQHKNHKIISKEQFK
jgi:hypothetical protein